MDETNMRQSMLLELIDNMHGRMADKAYPKEETPAELEVEDKEEASAEKPAEAEEPKADVEEPTDEELETMMKDMESQDSK